MPLFRRRRHRASRAQPRRGDACRRDYALPAVTGVTTPLAARPSQRRLRRLVAPGLMTVVMLGVLVGLGVWQVERLQWKTALLAQIATAEASPPVPLGVAPSAAAPTPWSKVSVTGRFRYDLAALYGAEVRDTRAGPTMGSQLIVPLERDGAPPVLVDRGWVPTTRTASLSQPPGPVTVVGYTHPADHAGWLSPNDDLPGRQFFTLDPAVIGRALGIADPVPFTLVALGEPPPEGWPAPAQHLPRPPNNHLSYAITWFGLAVTLAVIFLLWARKAVRR